MKTFLKLFILLSLPCALTNCKQNSGSVVLSKEARIVAFSFARNDSIPGFAEAVFVVDQLTDTGLIRMRKNDSIRFGTPLNKVVPQITYYASPSAVAFYLGDSVVFLKGRDTLDFSKQPIKIHVYAQDPDYSKWYNVEFKEHTVDGDLFHWETLAEASDQKQGVQKAIARLHNGGTDSLFFFQNDGFTTRLFLSDDLGKSWSEQTIEGLPQDCNVRQIVDGDNVFCYAQGKNLYYSFNGIQWEYKTLDIQMVAAYVCFNDWVWLAARDEQNIMRLYTINHELIPQQQKGLGLQGDSLPLSFPVQDYATVPFQNNSMHQHALIAGGFDRNGNMTNGRWMIEYNPITPERPYHISNIVSSSKDFGPFAGAAISYYGRALYMMGGIGENRDFLEHVYVSIDEGVHWTAVVDTLNPKRPDDFAGRWRANTFVRENDIYVIGGEDNSTTYSDTYHGRMNSINWPPIGD